MYNWCNYFIFYIKYSESYSSPARIRYELKYCFIFGYVSDPKKSNCADWVSSIWRVAYRPPFVNGKKIWWSDDAENNRKFKTRLGKSSYKATRSRSITFFFRHQHGRALVKFTFTRFFSSARVIVFNRQRFLILKIRIFYFYLLFCVINSNIFNKTF